MSRIIKKTIWENKKVILLIMASPFIAYCFNVFVTFIFHLGTYLGTYFRYLYSNMVC